MDIRDIRIERMIRKLRNIEVNNGEGKQTKTNRAE